MSYVQLHSSIMKYSLPPSFPPPELAGTLLHTTHLPMEHEDVIRSFGLDLLFIYTSITHTTFLKRATWHMACGQQRIQLFIINETTSNTSQANFPSPIAWAICFDRNSAVGMTGMPPGDGCCLRPWMWLCGGDRGHCVGPWWVDWIPNPICAVA